MFDLIAVGDVMLDVLLPPEAAGRHAPVAVRAGGSAVNAARFAAAEGARVAVVGRVGKDAAGRAIADELRLAGIESLLSADPRLATGSAVYRGEVLVADRGANAAFEAPPLPAARVTLVSGYLPRAAIHAALAGASGISGLDLQGVATGDFDAQVVIGPQLDLEVAGLSYRVACATLGAAGAAAVAGEERAAAAPPVVRAETLVGAGDAFAAAFLLALADGNPLTECLTRGCAAGSSV